MCVCVWMYGGKYMFGVQFYMIECEKNTWLLLLWVVLRDIIDKLLTWSIAWRIYNSSFQYSKQFIAIDANIYYT